MRLDSADPGRDERSDVTIAAVLAHRRRHLPQRRDRIAGHGHRRVGGEQGTARRVGHRCRRRQQFGHRAAGGRIDACGAECLRRHLRPCRQARLRRYAGPRVRQRPGNHLRLETREHGHDCRRSHRAKRRRAESEVGHPVSAQPEADARIADGRGEVHGVVQWLQTQPEPSCGVNGHHHILRHRSREASRRLAAAGWCRRGAAQARRSRGRVPAKVVAGWGRERVAAAVAG